MEFFSILTNRKRALIALIHSVAFLGIAMRGFASAKVGIVACGSVPVADIILIAIYLTVASILGWLAGISGCAKERIYFALCAGSATCGLLRTTLGDAALPAAQYMRVILLTSAVLLGGWIFRSFPTGGTESASAD